MREQPDNEWRWESRITPIIFEGYRFNIATGHHPDGRLLELAYSGPHNGSALARIVDDACLVLNELIQRHCPLERLTGAIRRNSDGNAESIIGEIVLQLAQSP